MSRRRLFTLGAAGTAAEPGTLLGASVSMARKEGGVICSVYGPPDDCVGCEDYIRQITGEAAFETVQEALQDVNRKTE